MSFFKKIIQVIFFLIIIIQMNNIIHSKTNIIERYPSKTKLEQGHDSLEDPEAGGVLLLENVHASAFIKDKSGIDYSINNVLGGTRDKAWCMNGDSIGEWMKVDIPLNQFAQEGMTNVYRILIINGYGKTKELYYANNRVKKIEVEFSEGEKVFLNLHDGDMELQRFKINIKAKWLKMTIKEIYKGKKYNDTCVGKIFFETN